MPEKRINEIQSVIEKKLLAHVRAMAAVVEGDNTASDQCKETITCLLDSIEEFTYIKKLELQKINDRKEDIPGML